MKSIEAQAKQYRNRAHAGAFYRGAEARYYGKPRTSCPYADRRSVIGNKPTWAKAFRSAWLAGYEAQDRREKAYAARLLTLMSRGRA